jgi:formylglycine-generating enzyme required for sulfatase activity
MYASSEAFMFQRNITLILFLSLIGTLCGGLFIVGCATGIPAPEETPMALISEGLTFKFGPDAPCRLNDDPNEETDNACQSYGVLAGTNTDQKYPSVTVKLKPFHIDVHEVTNIQFEFCERMGGCPNHNIINAYSEEQSEYHGTAAFDDFPVVQVTYEQAEAYCAFVGKRLPTEIEWERVARGNPDLNQNRRYPTEKLSNSDPVTKCLALNLSTKYCGKDELVGKPSTKAINGTSDPADDDYVVELGSGGEQRIFHLFGNAAEWTSSFYREGNTCALPEDLPCTPGWDCNGDPDCLDSAKDCDACPQSDDTCFYLCVGTNAQTIQCQPLPNSENSPLNPSDLTLEQGQKRVVRGGSVFDSGDRACRFRTAARDRARAPDDIQPFLGFRCAKDANL